MAYDLRSLIVETAADVGVSPIDLATAISYETAGTFDPAKRGPTTKWGQHRGFIQFGEPQAAQFGVDWNDPIGSQLGKGKAVAKYLKASGFKPGMSGLDLYSTINAGSPGRYGASDTAAGGAPGDVRDKWENQMGGHRAKAQALLGGAFAGMADGPKGQEAYPTAAPEQPFSFGGGGLLAGNRPINPELAALAGDEEKSPMAKFGGLLSAIGQAIPNAPQPQLGPMADAKQFGGLLSKYLSSMKGRA